MSLLNRISQRGLKKLGQLYNATSSSLHNAIYTNKEEVIPGGFEWEPSQPKPLPRIGGSGRAAASAIPTPAAFARALFKQTPAAAAAPQAEASITPGPITFIFSGYAAVLIVVALLVNRIQHVVPPRRPFRMETYTRIALRLPALILLGRAIALVLAKAGHAAKDSTSLWPRLAQSLLCQEYGTRDDASVMWSVFMSLGIACLSEAFVRALNSDPRAHPSVNLLSVSYLLHFHSTPAASPFLRPTPLVYILIALTLAEVLCLQIMDTLQLNLRLLITGLFSIGGQSAMLHLLYRASTNEQDPLALSAVLPALRHLTRLSELLFFGIAAMTVGLHALSQLIVEHKITREIFGHATRLPTMADDFSIAVIIYGTACLETTHLSGLANEVSSVSAPPDPYIELGKGQPAAADDPSTANSSIFLIRPQTAFPSDQLHGFRTEIKDVRAKPILGKNGDAPDQISRSSSVVAAGSRMVWIAAKIVFVHFRRLNRFLSHKSRLLRRMAAGPKRIPRALRWLGFVPTLRPPPPSTLISDVLLQWARDHHDSDADDGDFHIPTDDDSESESGDSSVEETQPPSPSFQEAGAMELYHDMLAPGQPEVSRQIPTEMNSVLLAHLTSEAAVTRQRYRQLAVSLPQAGASNSIDTRTIPHLDEARMEQLETQLMCVVCRCDVRRIICWPCRCLALCESCKDNLAAIPASQSLCPTCRKAVHGFSRIYIP